jgi:hypothetical protein
MPFRLAYGTTSDASINAYYKTSLRIICQVEIGISHELWRKYYQFSNSDRRELRGFSGIAPRD